nr:unnamed protein product [Callosobruchus chinensis]
MALLAGRAEVLTDIPTRMPTRIRESPGTKGLWMNT